MIQLKLTASLVFLMLVQIDQIAAAQPNQSAVSPDFKILSKVYTGGSEEAVSVNQTMFNGSLVFDFGHAPHQPQSPLEISIFDSRKNHFVLLDMRRKIKLSLDNLQLLRILDGLKNELDSVEHFKYLMFKEFEEDFKIDDNKVMVFNDFISYTAQGRRPDNDSILPRYYEFLDQYTLVSATDPGRMPPFARIRLNQSIKKYGFIPERVTRQTKSGSRFTNQAASNHRLMMNLTEDDLAKISLAKQDWINFRSVDLAEYRKIAVADADKSSEKR